MQQFMRPLMQSRIYGKIINQDTMEPQLLTRPTGSSLQRNKRNSKVVMRMKTKKYKDSRRVKRCRECGVEESDDEILTVHHVIARSQGGADSEENYILLCRDCHNDIESGDTESGFKRII